MRRVGCFSLTMMMAAGAAQAQVSPGMAEVMPPAVPVGTAVRDTAAISASVDKALDVVSATLAAQAQSRVNPYFVPGLRVELPAGDVSGASPRDIALAEAAREGLGRVLAGMEPALAPDVQARAVSDTTDIMSLVQSYRIADEILTPSYTLKVDMVYRPDAVQALLPRGTATAAGQVSGTVPPGPLTVVRVAGDIATQDKVYRALQKVDSRGVAYRRIALAEAEWQVTGLSADKLAAALQGQGLVAEVGADGAVVVRF
jgi:hypothetical protein